MQTDSPKVAAIWVAWKMIQEIGIDKLVGDVADEEKLEKLRKVFQDNYKAIAEVAGIDYESTVARG